MRNLAINSASPETFRLAIHLVATLMVALLLSSCQSSAQSPEYRTVTNEELVTLLEDENVQLVDVRTPEEVAQGIIAGADHIDIYDQEFVNKLSQLDKNRPVAVYCAAGGRSAKASLKLKELGFQQIYDLKGGYRGWQQAGFPVSQ
ncbi:MAG: rhodanese-like domain-containing protein [Marinoscillum sp.]|uniref:rhodanese-like domain-containing protein n=1 Tax=Marinoscillum sp. TaxID=2024838 RepID=UPI0033006118